MGFLDFFKKKKEDNQKQNNQTGFNMPSNNLNTQTQNQSINLNLSDLENELKSTDDLNLTLPELPSFDLKEQESKTNLKTSDIKKEGVSNDIDLNQSLNNNSLNNNLDQSNNLDNSNEKNKELDKESNSNLEIKKISQEKSQTNQIEKTKETQEKSDLFRPETISYDQQESKESLVNKNFIEEDNLFIEDKFLKKVFKDIADIKKQIKVSDELLKEVTEFENAKIKTFERFNSNIEEIEKKLIKIDSIIFD